MTDKDNERHASDARAQGFDSQLAQKLGELKGRDAKKDDLEPKVKDPVVAELRSKTLLPEDEQTEFIQLMRNQGQLISILITANNGEPVDVKVDPDTSVRTYTKTNSDETADPLTIIVTQGGAKNGEVRILHTTSSFQDEPTHVETITHATEWFIQRELKINGPMADEKPGQVSLRLAKSVNAPGVFGQQMPPTHQVQQESALVFSSEGEYILDQKVTHGTVEDVRGILNQAFNLVSPRT